MAERKKYCVNIVLKAVKEMIKMTMRQRSYKPFLERFKRFQLSAEEWWAMNECQRKDCVQKMYALSTDDMCR